jgi:NADH-quinone oxidoreductase subunit M
VGEFLVLAGTFKVSPVLTSIATLGFVLSAIYSLWFIQKVFHGPKQHEQQIADLGIREMTVMSFIMAGIILLGLFPQPILDTVRPALESIHSKAVDTPVQLAEKADDAQ